ncbi:MAG: redoxin domain-containing protein, partial [Actinomycetota bacterium]|nr:redoxin domain-containing protein [Actinomycetota bacterium]
MIARTRAPELQGQGGWIGVDRPLSLTQDLRGKVVMLDFWTFCCINCLRILEELRPIEERFADELVVIGVHSPKFPHERDHEAVRQAVARHRVAHPVLDDPEMETWDRYGVRAWPTLVVIDPEGYVVGMGSGEGLGPSIERLVEQLVAEHAQRGTLRLAPIRPEGVETITPGRPLAFPGKAVSDSDERLAISDTAHDRVIVTDRRGRVLDAFEGLLEPQGVRFDRITWPGSGEEEDVLLVCETGADRVVRVDLATGSRAVILDGIASPWDVLVEPGGTYLVAEAGRHRLWRCARDGSDPVVVAGGEAEGLRDGIGAIAHLAQPSGLALLDYGVAFTDAESSALRVLRDDDTVTTLVGTGLFEWGAADGAPEVARLQHPLGVATPPPSGPAGRDGAIYVADTFNSRLRVWRDEELHTLAVPGLKEPGGLDVLPDGGLLVADTNNHRVVRVDPGTGAVEVIRIHGLPDSARPTERSNEPDTPPVDVEEGPPFRVPPGARIAVPFSVDVGGEALDPSSGPPVRVVLDSEPASLLEGPRSWGLHET